MSIWKQNPISINKMQPVSIVITTGGPVVYTEAPTKPTITAAAQQNGDILIEIGRAQRAQSYQLQRSRRNSDDTSWNRWQSRIELGLRREYVISASDVTAGRRERFRVQATNNAGTGDWSDIVVVTPLQPFLPPTYTVSQVLEAIQIQFTAPASGVTPLNFQYQFEIANENNRFTGEQGNQSRRSELLATNSEATIGEFPADPENEPWISGRMYRLRVRSTISGRQSDWGAWVVITFT